MGRQKYYFEVVKEYDCDRNILGEAHLYPVYFICRYEKGIFGRKCRKKLLEVMEVSYLKDRGFQYDVKAHTPIEGSYYNYGTDYNTREEAEKVIDDMLTNPNKYRLGWEF